MTEDPAGRLVVTLDLDGVTDRAGLMDRCARTLGLPGLPGLPDPAGRDWDALADSLADPSAWPEGAAERGLLVVVRGWRAYAETRPDEWAVAEEVFGEATDRGPGLFVTLGPGGSSKQAADRPG
ncbi:barstar family protein [Streptomyces sp. NPDC006367]|uniref:barstar family protein n=1 Tax=unclassified Streptomyces TaxID=2593676 RepID=UPI00339F96A0